MFNLLRFPGIFLILFIYVPVFFSSCGSVTKMKQQNFAKIYKRSLPSLNPDFLVFHDNDSISKVYFRINTKELLYSKKENEESFMAKVMIHYKLFESYESDVLLDSASSYVTDICRENDCSSLAGRNEIVGDFNIKVINGRKYILEIITTDLYRNQSGVKHEMVDKTNQFVRQNFILRSTESGIPVFRNYLALNEKTLLQYTRDGNTKVLCRYYHRNFPVAPPPFSVFEPAPFDYQADSIFGFNTDSSGNAGFVMEKNGFYHFLADSAQKEGFTLFCFPENFPGIGNAADLIMPLRYITSKKEFSEITANENKKEAVDKFWLGVGTNPDRSKELIRQYYNRVQDANRFFTAHMEGWKTDRGMIYIVFGAPNIIYKTNETESWLYGEENNFMSISFNFYKVTNPFSDNDYLLERSPIYKANYYKAVDTWREGRVFTTN